MNYEHLLSLEKIQGIPKGFMNSGKSQLAMLRDLGMSPDSKLLDIGCGWLRSGVWFIDYLEPNCFFGIEPWEERLELGWSRVLWEGLREEKRPSFDRNENWDCSVFGVLFDFCVASSIWSHCGKRDIQVMLENFAAHSNPGATVLASFWRATEADGDYCGDRWIGKNKDDDQGINKIHHDLGKLKEICIGCGFDSEDLYPDRDYSWLAIAKR